MRRILLSTAATLMAASVAMSASAADLVMGQGANITGIDPHWHRHAGNNSVAGHVFESLATRNAKAEMVPVLATKWEPTGEAEWTYTLRKGVTFHNGQPFTAEDVKCSFERVKAGVPNNPGGFSGFTKGIERIEVKDPHTVVFHTKGPYPILYLDAAGIFIIPCDIAKTKTTEDFTRGPAMIGTGPYEFVEWIPGQHLKFKAFANYWGGKEPWNNVTIRFMTNAPARLAALLSGDVDVIGQVPTTDIERLKSDNRVKLWSSGTTRVNYVAMGHYDSLPVEFYSNIDGSPLKENPYKDVRVRKALSLAIDRNVLKDRVNQGQAVIAKTYLVEGSFGQVEGYDMSTYDPAEAKRLLAEAGYPNGFRQTLYTSNDRIVNAVKTVQAMAQMYARVGIKTEVETMPHSVFSKRRNKLELPLFMSSWGNSLVDPMGFLPPLILTYNKEKGHGRANRARYSNPEVDRLILESMTKVDPKERDLASQKAMKAAMDDYAMLPLTFWNITYGTRAGLSYEARFDQYLRADHVRSVTN